MSLSSSSSKADVRLHSEFWSGGIAAGCRVPFAVAKEDDEGANAVRDDMIISPVQNPSRLGRTTKRASNYYLVSWHSYLEIGDATGNHLNAGAGMYKHLSYSYSYRDRNASLSRVCKRYLACICSLQVRSGTKYPVHVQHAAIMKASAETSPSSISQRTGGGA